MADEEKVKVEIPDPPAILPKDLQAKWKETYQGAFEEAQNDDPGDTVKQRQTALREANRVLRVEKITSAEQALNLPKWKFAQREEKDGTLKVVTIDGKKYSFPVSGRGKKPAEPNGAGQSAGQGGGATPPAA